MKRARLSVPALLLCCCALPALAAGPIDGEVGAVWWANDFDYSSEAASTSTSAGAPGFRAELWFFNKFGARAERYSSDVDALTSETADYTSIDALWRPFSPTQNNFLALGLGWQDMDMSTIGLDGETSGPRAVLEGRVSLGGLFYAYGHGSYMPELDDAQPSDPMFGEYEDLSAYQLELGVSWKAAPFLSVRGGYMTYATDFRQTGIDPLLGVGTELDGEVESKGFLVGLSARF
jgi:hypothetical protein